MRLDQHVMSQAIRRGTQCQPGELGMPPARRAGN
jgi:hypothetical protein